MSSSQSDFINSNLLKLGYASKQDIIENLFIQSLIESYNRIDKNIGIENEIRDRFRDDLYFHNDSLVKKWLQLNIIFLDWENWVFTSGRELARTDITFKLSGIKFIIECKRLKSADKAYIEEGVERFISLKYSEGDEYSGMAGFVIAGDKTSICKDLKDKIASLKHTTTISKISSFDRFTSNHIRIDKTQIEVYHLFFNFNLFEN